MSLYLYSCVNKEDPNTKLFWNLSLTSSYTEYLLLRPGNSLHLPVCVRLCRCSSSLRVKRLPQYVHEQTNGRSPVCHRRWARRWDVFPYTFPQPGIWQICCFFLPGSPEPLKRVMYKRVNQINWFAYHLFCPMAKKKKEELLSHRIIHHLLGWLPWTLDLKSLSSTEI